MRSHSSPSGSIDLKSKESISLSLFTYRVCVITNIINIFLRFVNSNERKKEFMRILGRFLRTEASVSLCGIKR